MINRNKSCIWMLEQNFDKKRRYMINRNKSCIWMKTETKEKKLCRIRLIETRVVFEFPFQLVFPPPVLVINRNKSCIWIYMATLDYRTSQRLIETRVVFEFFQKFYIA